MLELVTDTVCIGAVVVLAIETIWLTVRLRRENRGA